MASRRIAILQARTTSSRLPAKVMLPVNGIPLVVLAARRAANTGIPVLVATSRDETDDGLVQLLARHGIAHMRGDLNDTLARFAAALDGFGDETLVFRLTADNVVPDGHLLDEMQAVFEQRGLAYLGCGGAGSGLPYGVSAELMRAGLLRRGAREATSPYDREHVTPIIRTLVGDTRHTAHAGLALENFRCTVDILEDYLVLQNLFANRNDIENEHFLEIVKRLRELSPECSNNSQLKCVTLGTAQLGLGYGISNTTGQPPMRLAQELVRTAISRGIAAVDTARAYGSSEHVVGLALQKGWRERVSLVTKLDPLDDVPGSASPEFVEKAVRASVFQSLTELRDIPDVLMLHRASHVLAWQGRVVKQLLRLRDEGYVRDLGVSVQSLEEFSLALSIADLKHIQLPFNVLDWRWDGIAETIAEVRAKRPLVIHARSALLQGLLASAAKSHWQRAHIPQSHSIVELLKKMAGAVGCASVAEMCLRFSLAQPWIDQVVIGMESQQQLDENLRICSLPSLTPENCATLRKMRPRLEQETLDPTRWRAIK